MGADSHALIISVRLLDHRYHGDGDWPPSPFRVFQALIAGALVGQPPDRAAELAAAFGWLETLDPPVIAVPDTNPGREYRLFVPNNDADTIGGDPTRIAKIRTTKRVAPLILKPECPLHYLWEFEKCGDDHAATIVAVAQKLYQLGRGVDMAFATAEVLPTHEAQERLAQYDGTISQPSQQGRGGVPLRSPTEGSFASLVRRHRAKGMQHDAAHVSRATPGRYRTDQYDARIDRFLFDLVDTSTADERYCPVALGRASELVEQLRDRIAHYLMRTCGRSRDVVERFLIGRGAVDADKAKRIRIVPLPSIGSKHADHAIRRVLIEVPSRCPIPIREVKWVAAMVRVGTALDDASGFDDAQLVRATDHGMLKHYGIDDRGDAAARVWRTVTPAVLIIPRLNSDNGSRAARDTLLGHAARQAVRHAGLDAHVEAVHVQREPFDGRGEASFRFTRPLRFAARGLHHVEITFSRARSGPIVIGDGRFLGLGLMQPVRDAFPDLMVHKIVSTPVAVAHARQLAHAIRRALMALSRDIRGTIPKLFSGHEPDGGPALSGHHEHVFIAGDDADGDGSIDRILLAAPWTCDRSTKGDDTDRRRFHDVASKLDEVRAGRLGVIRMSEACPLAEDDPVVQPSKVWASRTPYGPTRLAGLRKEAREQISRDVIEECTRRGLPRPTVEVLSLAGNRSGRGVVADLRLRFDVSVRGPLLLGYDSHLGAGLFAAVA